MKKKKLVMLVLISFFAGILGIDAYLLSLFHQGQNKQAKVTSDKFFGWKFPVAKFPLTGNNGKLIAYSSIRDPGGIPQGLPVRLKIPIIGVDSAIEDALITPDGRMDVPAGSVNVAWFSLGPHPGDVGSAVIGGHFGIENGVPFVFYSLDKIKIGDKIYIVNDKNDTLAFIVKSIKSFDRNADATAVFTSGDGIAHLNLITCEGVWNQINGAYPQRLVVFADAIPAEGAVEVKPQLTAAAKLPQTALATPTLLPTQTLALASTIVPSSIPKILLSKPSSVKNSSVLPQILIQSAKSLYDNPIDGIITSLLLISIGFIAFKILKR